MANYEVEQLRTALEEARAKIVEQQEFIDALRKPPRLFATIFKPTKVEGEDAAILATGNGLIEEYVDPKLAARLRSGQTVYMSNGAITDIYEGADILGPIALVAKVVNDNLLEVEHESHKRAVYVCSKTFPDVKEGNRVVLDPTGVVVTADLGREKERFAFVKDTGIKWGDIGGLEEQKAVMREAIEFPILYKDLYKSYNKKPLKGVLLEGPPGCGKTMLAKAAASAISAIHKAKGSGFLYIKGPEILSKWVGEAEATIRAIFRQARDHKKEYGYPALLFIDEAEAILSTRGSGVSSDMEKTIVPQFLAEMDGLEESGAFVLLATNRADRLDPAVIRDGRIDRAIRVPRPDQLTATQIFLLNLEGVPVGNKTSALELAAFCAEEVFAPSRVLYEINRKSGKDMVFTLASILNGAMCAKLVDRATSIALHRDLAKGGKKVSGVSPDDMRSAVNDLMKANQHLDHSQELAEMCGGFRDDISQIRRVGAAAA